MSNVKECPISFKPEMVRAVLTDQKTQTRRIMKVQPQELKPGMWAYPASRKYLDVEPGTFVQCEDPANSSLITAQCPYGQPGDVLWVRENFRYVTTNPATPQARYDVQYGADGSFGNVGQDHPQWLETNVARNTWKGLGTELEYQTGKPPMHMPRLAARILLEIVSVRVEQVQHISEEDAKAEGVETVNGPDKKGRIEWKNYLDSWAFEYFARDSFATLWDSINAEEGKENAKDWNANPWVWVIEFRRI